YYNKNLEIINAGFVNLSEATEIDTWAVINDKFYTFYIKHSKGFDEIYAVELQINNYQKSSNLIQGTPSLLMQIPNNGSGYHAVFDIEVSSNAQFLSIIAASPYSANAKEVIETILLDKDLKKVYQTSIHTGIISQKRSYNSI